MRLIYLDGASVPYIKISEHKDVYVSNYSKLLIESLPISLEGKTVCDFGSGTGVITICCCAKQAKKVVAIEIDDKYRELTGKNINDNISLKSVDIYGTSEQVIGSTDFLFDYIFCNPASLPSIVGNDSFYSGGEFGLDMILEVVNFANLKLAQNGHLVILITSIIPTSLFHEELIKLNMRCSVINSTNLKFRQHYKNIKNWVDTNQMHYPEMLYFNYKGQLFEKVIVYDVYRR